MNKALNLSLSNHTNLEHLFGFLVASLCSATAMHRPVVLNLFTTSYHLGTPNCQRLPLLAKHLIDCWWAVTSNSTNSKLLAKSILLVFELLVLQSLYRDAVRYSFVKHKLQIGENTPELSYCMGLLIFSNR